MLEDSRLKKRVIIIIGFVLLFAILSFLMWWFFAPAASCTDKKQNQSEKGIDCGGPCSPCKVSSIAQDIIIKETAFAAGGNNTYDVEAKILNQNDIEGASAFDYTFTLKDLNENIIATRDGVNFILPSDTKYIAQLAIQTKNNTIPAKIEFSIKNVKLEKLVNVDKPQLGIYNKKFSPLPSGVGSEVGGVLRNESFYDLGKIFLVIILRDQENKVIGINTTEQNLVRAKEERSFILTWPYELDGNISSLEVDSQSNVFDKQNFVSSPYIVR